MTVADDIVMLDHARKNMAGVVEQMAGIRTRLGVCGIGLRNVEGKLTIVSGGGTFPSVDRINDRVTEAEQELPALIAKLTHMEASLLQAVQETEDFIQRLAS